VGEEGKGFTNGDVFAPLAIVFPILLNQFRNSQHKSVKNVIKSRSGRGRSNKQTKKPNVQAFRMEGRKEGSWKGENGQKKNNCFF
jgi:hypothetical protein